MVANYIILQPYKMQFSYNNWYGGPIILKTITNLKCNIKCVFGKQIILYWDFGSAYYYYDRYIFLNNNLNVPKVTKKL